MAAVHCGGPRVGCRQQFVVSALRSSDQLRVANLYAGKPFAFDGEAQFIGSVLAQHASVAMSASASDANWRTAIDGRDAIEQAKGLLMQRRGATGLHAFKMLVTASQEANVKLVEVARWLVEQHDSGAIPELTPSSGTSSWATAAELHRMISSPRRWRSTSSRTGRSPMTSRRRRSSHCLPQPGRTDMVRRSLMRSVGKQSSVLEGGSLRPESA